MRKSCPNVLATVVEKLPRVAEAGGTTGRLLSAAWIEVFTRLPSFLVEFRASFIQRSGHEHERNPAEMDHRGLRRNLRHPVLEPGLLLHQRSGPRGVPPAGPGGGLHRPERARRRGGAAGNRASFAGSFLGHSEEPRGGTARGLQERDHGVRLQSRVSRRLPHQGQPAPLRGRGDRAVRPALPLRPGGWLQARAAGGDGHPRRRGSAHRVQWVQGRGVHRDRAHVLQARAQGAHRGGEVLRAGPHRVHGEEDRGQAPHRHPGETGVQRVGPVGGLRGRPLQVRSVHARGGRGGAFSARCRHAQLLRAAALSPGQPDLCHSRHQERAARGKPFLCRDRRTGRAAQVLRRRRRPGRGLRRVADQLRLVDELHPAGVRQ